MRHRQIPPKVTAAMGFVKHYWESQGRSPFRSHGDSLNDMDAKETSVKDAALEVLSNYFRGETDDTVISDGRDEDEGKRHEPAKVPV